MIPAASLKAILRTDALRLQRDRFLIGMGAYIIGVALALRFALPWISAELQARAGFDLQPWLPLMSSHFVVGLAGLLAGIIGGFMLLESREERTIKAMLVSPLPLSHYVAVVATVVLVTGTLLGVAQGLLLNVALPPLMALLACSLAAAPTAVLMALFISTFADTKIEAMVLMKVCAMLPLVPTGCYFLPEPWQWVGAWHPSWWAAKAYWMAEAGGGPWALFAAGAAIPATLWLGVLDRAFIRAAHRT